MMCSRHTPIVLTPLVGKTLDGHITIEVNKNENYKVAFFGSSSDGSGYLLLEENVLSSSNLLIQPVYDSITHINFTLYDRINKTKKGIAYFNLKNFDIVYADYNYAAFYFNITRKLDLYVTSTPVYIWCSINKLDWNFQFTGNEYNFSNIDQIKLQYGGPLKADLYVRQPSSFQNGSRYGFM